MLFKCCTGLCLHLSVWLGRSTEKQSVLGTDRSWIEVGHLPEWLFQLPVVVFDVAVALGAEVTCPG